MFWISIVVDSGDRPRYRRLHVVAEALACAAEYPRSFSSSFSAAWSAISTSSIRNASRATPTAKEKAFTSLQADDIEEVQIKNADGETTRLQKTDGTWQTRRAGPGRSGHQRDDHRSPTVSRRSRSSASSTRTPGDLKQYGLEPARIEVAFRPKGQKDLRRVQLGEKTPTGSDLYARLPDQKRVFLVSSFLDATFNKNDVRVARPPHPDIRPCDGGRTRVDERDVQDTTDQERVRLEAGVADPGSSGLCRRRGGARASLLDPDAGHRRPGREGPREVRPDETHWRHHRERRQLRRDAHAGIDGECLALRQGFLAASWSLRLRRFSKTT